MKRIVDKVIRSGRFPFKSQGQSMLPILQPNDILYFKKTTLAKTKVNDLVIVKKRNQLICHRVIYKKKNYLITKGDNAPKSDGKILPRQIIGKVIKIKRGGNIFSPENLYLIHSTLYFQEIVKIKKAFEEGGITFVFLKGLPLHLYYEKSHPRRLYLDCDVLIERDDFKKADKVLSKFGYKKARTELSAFHKRAKDKEVENAYFKIIHNVPVVFDLHLELVFMMTQLGRLEALYRQSLIDSLTKRVLRDKRKVKIHNIVFPILSPAHLVVYLALHLFHHNFRGAFRYDFLDKVIRREFKRKDKDKLFFKVGKIIQKYRLKNFVAPVFFLLVQYYKTPLPRNFLKSLKPLKFDIKKVNIFDHQLRIQAGIERFKNLFSLSPNPWWIRVLVFFNFSVLYTIGWVIFNKLKRRVSYLWRG